MAWWRDVRYESGDVDAAAAASREIAVWSSLNTALLVVATVLMVIKPG